jgi:hypothetical protein
MIMQSLYLRIKKMLHIKTAKIYLCFAVLLFVAKPFLGFGMFSRLHPPAIENIFVKSFTKRKAEFSEDSNYSTNAVQKKLANPPLPFILRFSCLLSIIFPAVFAFSANITNRLLSQVRLSFYPSMDSCLLNGKLII